MIQSKFKKQTLFAIGTAILLCLILIVFLAYTYANDPTAIEFLLLIVLFILFLFWLIWGELRTKAILIFKENDQVFVKNFAGLGKKTAFNMDTIDGYKLSNLSTEYRSYEYLYLLRNHKKVLKISEFYHANYSELKSELTRKIKKTGTDQFNLLNEIKEIFR